METEWLLLNAFDNDVYKIHAHLHEALDSGRTVELYETSLDTLLSNPKYLFEVFDDVFEHYPIAYVLNHIYFNTPWRHDTTEALEFCLEYWKRERATRAWSCIKA